MLPSCGELRQFVSVIFPSGIFGNVDTFRFIGSIVTKDGSRSTYKISNSKSQEDTQEIGRNQSETEETDTEVHSMALYGWRSVWINVMMMDYWYEQETETELYCPYLSFN